MSELDEVRREIDQGIQPNQYETKISLDTADWLWNKVQSQPPRWVPLAFAALGYYRDHMTAEEVTAVQEFLDRCDGMPPAPEEPNTGETE